MARRVALGFERFWNPETGCLYDVVDGPCGADPAVRPNQLLAVSLPDSPLSAGRRRAVLDRCAAVLLAPGGLRSLAPGDAGYEGRRADCEAPGDPARHLGAAWPWLLPHFALAHYRVHRDRARALAALEPLEAELERGVLGQLGERLDGDPPHSPQGMTAHAWAVGEALRVWHMLIAAPALRPAGRGGRTLRLVGVR